MTMLTCGTLISCNKKEDSIFLLGIENDSDASRETYRVNISKFYKQEELLSGLAIRRKIILAEENPLDWSIVGLTEARGLIRRLERIANGGKIKIKPGTEIDVIALPLNEILVCGYVGEFKAIYHSWENGVEENEFECTKEFEGKYGKK